MHEKVVERMGISRGCVDCFFTSPPLSLYSERSKTKPNAGSDFHSCTLTALKRHWKINAKGICKKKKKKIENKKPNKLFSSPCEGTRSICAKK